MWTAAHCAITAEANVWKHKTSYNMLGIVDVRLWSRCVRVERLYDGQRILRARVVHALRDLHLNFVLCLPSAAICTSVVLFSFFLFHTIPSPGSKCNLSVSVRLYCIYLAFVFLIVSSNIGGRSLRLERSSTFSLSLELRENLWNQFILGNRKVISLESWDGFFVCLLWQRERISCEYGNPLFLSLSERADDSLNRTIFAESINCGTSIVFNSVNCSESFAASGFTTSAKSRTCCLPYGCRLCRQCECEFGVDKVSVNVRACVERTPLCRIYDIFVYSLLLLVHESPPPSHSSLRLMAHYLPFIVSSMYENVLQMYVNTTRSYTSLSIRQPYTKQYNSRSQWYHCIASQWWWYSVFFHTQECSVNSHPFSSVELNEDEKRTQHINFRCVKTESAFRCGCGGDSDSDGTLLRLLYQDERAHSSPENPCYIFLGRRLRSIRCATSMAYTTISDGKRDRSRGFMCSKPCR